MSLIALAVAVGPAAAQASPPAAGGAITLPAEAARFAPVDPRRPDGAGIAVLRGDPATGPSDMLMRMPRGGGRMHTHTADYTLTVLSGRMRHWQQGEAEAAAPVLGPGSYWFQPGGKPHADSCLDDSCLMVISWSGKRDAQATP